MLALPKRESSLAPIRPMLARQVWCEFLLQIRMPMGLIWSLIITSILYLFLGLGYAGQDVAGIDGKTYMLASFAALGTFNTMLFTFGGGVASDRGARRHILYRAMPVRPAVLLGARAIVACALTAVMVGLVTGTGIAIGVRISPIAACSLIARLTLGGIPFLAMGLMIGYLIRPSSVAVVFNVLSLGFAFLSGIYVPIPVTDGALQPVANLMPTYRLAELGWDAVGAQTANSMFHTVLVLVLYTAVFTLLALRAYQREEKRTFE
ncbi:MAG TPA: ABC transporter permease [Thermomicrobiales bacterium]|nr:ABC transporter permease [Thermomicrobiales bacterium]